MACDEWRSVPVALADASWAVGFTGTCLVVDRPRRLVVVLLTNRVHPSRDWSDIGELRRAVARLASHRWAGWRGVERHRDG